MSEHTNGPLDIAFSTSIRYDERGDVAIVDEEGRIIGEAFDLVAPDTHRPALANARLWAAAPDLLAACKAALFPAGDTPRQLHDQLLAAIRKAEGTHPATEAGR